MKILLLLFALMASTLFAETDLLETEDHSEVSSERSSQSSEPKPKGEIPILLIPTLVNSRVLRG
ncbi:MAG: hypothetical protein JJT75_04330 [Opitutales bacterium]|nr:hypothetical protein [Opitutales bacterium]MCH8541153.1 hypothetical protein [Opitutales bacterium]